MRSDDDKRKVQGRRYEVWRGPLVFGFLLFAVFSFLLPSGVRAQEVLRLDELIAEALKNSPDLLVSESKVSASRYRIPQAKALPDPMFMFGYQNEGFDRITLGEEQGAQGMFTVSQMFPFPGKRGLKGEMATKDAESIEAMHRATTLKIVATVKQLYYDLFLAYKNIDILKKLTEYFSRVEDAATARYSSGMASQQEVVMAQTEKYMLLEKEEMQRQKIDAIQGMLNSTIGRNVNIPLGRPAEPVSTPYSYGMEELLRIAKSNSPEIRSREKMVEAAEAKVKMAKKEFYPDVTLGASYYPRTKDYMDMWNLTATINIPIFYKDKQEPAVQEASANLLGAKRELSATEYMLSSNIRENYSMAQAAERLMTIYKEGLIPKTYQDFQLALSGYATGKIEAITAISRLKAVLDTETLYWGQYIEREKAIARLEAIAGNTDSLSGVKEK
jgi:outer membrane protein, heavy metal efflux system